MSGSKQLSSQRYPLELLRLSYTRISLYISNIVKLKTTYFHTNLSAHIVADIDLWLCLILALGPSVLFFLFRSDRFLNSSSVYLLFFNDVRRLSVIRGMIFSGGSFPALFTISFTLTITFSCHSFLTSASCWGSHVNRTCT